MLYESEICTRVILSFHSFARKTRFADVEQSFCSEDLEVLEHQWQKCMNLMIKNYDKVLITYYSYCYRIYQF